MLDRNPNLMVHRRPIPKAASRRTNPLDAKVEPPKQWYEVSLHVHLQRPFFHVRARPFHKATSLQCQRQCCSNLRCQFVCCCLVHLVYDFLGLFGMHLPGRLTCRLAFLKCAISAQCHVCPLSIRRSKGAQVECTCYAWNPRHWARGG